MRDQTAIVGIGATEYFRRGRSLPSSSLEMAGKAVLAALDDAGLTVDDLDGFTGYCGGYDVALLAQWLGVPEVCFTGISTGGGGGASASIGMAATAIDAGHAKVVASVLALQTLAPLGAALARTGGQHARALTPDRDFYAPYGLFAPGHQFAMLVQRHMHTYGTTREHLAEIAISTRANASRRPTALMRQPITLDDYFNAPMIAEPFCRLDFCLESDGAVAIVTTSAQRAKDLRHPPVYIRSWAMGGPGTWGGMIWMNMPEDEFASGGHRTVAARLYRNSGLGPEDVDVALMYDHFTGMVLMCMEDYGLCPVGEGGPFVADGNIRWPNGTVPLNTHGGNLSEAYLMGFSHVKEAVEQLRGDAINQVEGAEVALVTSGPSVLPQSSMLLRR